MGLLLLDDLDEVLGENDVLIIDSVGKQRGNLLDGKSGDATANAGDKEPQLGVLAGKGHKLVHIGLNDIYTAVHRGNRLTLSLQAYALPPHGAIVVHGSTRSVTSMHSAQVAAKHKYLILF